MKGLTAKFAVRFCFCFPTKKIVFQPKNVAFFHNAPNFTFFELNSRFPNGGQFEIKSTSIQLHSDIFGFWICLLNNYRYLFEVMLLLSFRNRNFVTKCSIFIKKSLWAETLYSFVSLTNVEMNIIFIYSWKSEDFSRQNLIFFSKLHVTIRLRCNKIKKIKMRNTFRLAKLIPKRCIYHR